MRKMWTYISILAAAAVMMSCSRRDMVDVGDNNVLELILDLKVEVENEGTVDLPQIMSTTFYHPEQHHALVSDYMGPKGGRVQIDPGTYDLLIYNFDTYSTHMREDSHYHTAEAYTNPVQVHERAGFDYFRSILKAAEKDSVRGESRGYLDDPIIYEPDHLFVSNIDGVVIKNWAETNGHQVIHSTVNTIVQVFNILIGPIKGEEYIASAVVYLTGQVPSVNLSKREITGVPSTIYFPIDVDEHQKQFVGKFRTFGKYPGVESRVFLIVDIIDTGGGRDIWEWDVTDQFEDPDNRDIIIEDDDIVVKESSQGGGFEPVVHPWNEHNANIIL